MPSKRSRERIALLEEQKQVIVHRAVTGQIDVRTGGPYPAYKDSSVDWLGKIPGHWRLSRLTNIATLTNGFPFDSTMFDRAYGIPLVRIRDMFSTETEVQWSGEPVPEAEIRNGDILIGMDGDFNVAWWAQGRALLNQRVCCVRSRSSGVTQRWLFYCLHPPLKALNDFTSSTTVKHLSSLDVLKFRLPLPPVAEQRVITRLLDDQTARVAALTVKGKRENELLKEFHSRLIADIVTGKLDVREAAAVLSDGASE